MPPRGPHRRGRAAPAGPGPPRRGDVTLLDARVLHDRRPASSSRSSGRAAPARRRCWRRSPASPRRLRDRCASTASTCTPTWAVPRRARVRARRTTSSTPTCRSSARSATRRGSGCRRRRRAAEVDDAVRDALDAVGLTAQADVRVGSLSGGQRKRASIAVELLTDPHVFFLDEPTSGLDPVTSAELIARLRRARRRVGDGRVHDALRRGPGAVRSHRVHGARRAGGLRRDRRRGARAVRGRLGPGALPPPGRRGRAIAATGRDRGAGSPAPEPVARRGTGDRWRARSRSGACSRAARSRCSCATG